MTRENKRNKVVYIPYIISNSGNEYVPNMIKILQDEYIVFGNLAGSANILQMLQTKAVFLNWIEDQSEFGSKMKVQLILHKLLGAKIIWVFHNKYPHDAAFDHKVISNMNWLARHSSIIMLHSKKQQKIHSKCGTK